jgi:hypothetical protein
MRAPDGDWPEPFQVSRGLQDLASPARRHAPGQEAVIMRGLVLLAITSTLFLAACSGKPPSAEQRAAARDDLNLSSRPYDGPRGVPATNPPADNNFDRLYCHPQGQGSVCERGQ